MALLLVAYLVKGLMKYEPVGCFLLDLAMVLKRMDEIDLRKLVVAARVQKSDAALRLCLRAVRKIVPLPPILEQSASDERRWPLSDEALFHQLVSPGTPSTWPRVKLLMRTCDRLEDAVKGIAWEIGRKVAQRAHHARLF